MKFSLCAFVAVVFAATASAAKAPPVDHKINLLSSLAGVERLGRFEASVDTCLVDAHACYAKCNLKSVTAYGCVRPCAKKLNQCEIQRCKPYAACSVPLGKNSSAILEQKCFEKLQLC